MFRAPRSLRPNSTWLTQRVPNLFFSFTTSAGQPNAPLDLDPSFRALLEDVDISLINRKSLENRTQPHRELEVFPPGLSLVNEVDTENDITDEEGHKERKSPAALFGSDRIGAVVLPLELQKSISLLISESDKRQLRNDAKRLFLGPEEGGGSDAQWEAKYDVKYRSRSQAARHFERDGTAFASIALPAHFSAIYSVLDHAKRRIGPEWNVENVIDWGAGTGSGLWASLYSFQKASDTHCENAANEMEISRSNVATYLGLDKRDGLVAIGKQLLRNVNMGSLSASWQKSFKDEDKIKRSDGYNTLALSAFMLSSLPTTLAKKALVKEMWESGAHVLVLIDHNTTAGFESIAEAREYFLKVGLKEFDDPATESWPIRGSHIVAPCPHDAACPLRHPGSSRLVCGFSQRLQRPAFVRLTKHSGVGHEDIGYSYIVVRRGPRPSAADVKSGRIGEVGRRALEKEASLQVPVRELTVHDHHNETRLVGTEPSLTNASSQPINPELSNNEPQSRAELQEALRFEAFGWPRLVFPPLKRSGHVILDCCTAEGKIMRMTIPKSQGKQAYYDARKSNWGDMFPHEPKNPPQERYQPMRAKRDGGTTPTKGQDIGKRSRSHNSEQPTSYDALSEDLKAKRKLKRRERNLSEEAELD